MSLALTRSRWHIPSRRPLHRRARPIRDRSSLWIGAICLAGIVAVALVVATATAIWLIAWFGQFAGALPSPDQLTARAPFQTTPVYASDGTTVLYEITDPEGGRRTIVKLSQVPRYLIEATIATEDAGFFSNPGFELRAIFRAAVEDLSHQQVLSGASTITQQVARNVLLTPAERLDLSARRKVKEIVLAYQLTQTYTKDEILSVYLNEIYYGHRSYGVEAAAETYFGKSVSQLDLAECALIASLPSAPAYYDPYVRLDAVKERQQYILQRMVDQGYITEAQARAAASEPLHLVDHRRAPIAPHFVNYVSDLLQTRLGTDRLYHGGYHVVTTLNAPLQSLAERAVSAHPEIFAKGSGNNVAVVALDPRDGHILAMVGSANYDDTDIAGEVNMALAPRESSGVLNPLTYALALERGETLVSRVVDEPQTSLDATGTDLASARSDQHQYLGPVTLRQAIGLGLGAPALHLMTIVGNQSLIDLMTRIGVPNFAQRVSYASNFAIAGARVSPLEVAQVYAALADAGVAHRPIAIERVVDSNERVIYQDQPEQRQALPAGIAYLVSSALADPSVRAPEAENALKLDRPVAVHVATSDDRRDSWAAGYFPNLAVVVWVGSTNGRPLEDIQAAPEIWGSFVREALKFLPPADYTRPSDVAEISLCQNPACTSRRSEIVLKGTEKAAEDANANAIGRSQAGVTSSQTPLVNRAQTNARPPGQIVSSGLVTVPDVTGTTLDQARVRLTAAGLTNSTIVKYVSGAELSAAQRNIAVGQVVATSPAAGERTAPGTSVVLTVRRN